jgi:RHS repeat-associated protein
MKNEPETTATSRPGVPVRRSRARLPAPPWPGGRARNVDRPAHRARLAPRAHLRRAGDLVIERDPTTGRVASTHLVSGQVVDSTQHDPDFGLVAHYAALVGGNEVYAYDITGRDALGRITTKTERTQGEVHTWAYGYDLAGRLVDVWKDGNDLAHRVSHYDYDANGNRLAKVTLDGTTMGTYDAQDRIKTYGTLSYTFTANGELATKTDTATGDVTEYTYDARGNLKRVVLHAGAPGQKTIDYVVDGLNHRMWKKVDGVAVKGWLWRDALAPVAELDGAGNVTATFVYGGKVNVPEYVVTPTARLRVVTDHLGSPHALVDEATGAVVMRADYDEFGNVSVTPPGAAGMVAFGFAGGIWDPETGLVRFGARDYDPGAGRWTAPDPVRFDGGDSNLHAYAASNPINATDPSGAWLFTGPFLADCGPGTLCSAIRDAINGFLPQQPAPVHFGTCPADDNDGKPKCTFAGKIFNIMYMAPVCLYQCPNGKLYKLQLEKADAPCPSAVAQ